MIISAGASSLGAFFAVSFLMWLCVIFLNALAWGGCFFGWWGALNLFNGGRGELGDFGCFWDEIWGKFKNN